MTYSTLHTRRQPASDYPKRYGRAIEASKRARWDLEQDVLRGRALDASSHFLPDSLCRMDLVDVLGPTERRLDSPIQGRTYAYLFGLVERFIKCSIADRSELSPLFRDVFRVHWMEESQHAVMDELELRAEHARLTPEGRGQGVSDFIALLGAELTALRRSCHNPDGCIVEWA